MADANQLARALGEGPADADTFAAALWRDAGGALFAVASLDVSEEWFAAAEAPLAAPDWGADLAAAGRAQAALAVWHPLSDFPPPGAGAARIAVLAGLPPAEAISALGLLPVVEENPLPTGPAAV